jgi:hypothetical protein
VSISKNRPQKVQFIVSHELDFGACAPLTKEFPPLFTLPFEKSLAITNEVLDVVIDIAALSTGLPDATTNASSVPQRDRT